MLLVAIYIFIHKFGVGRIGKDRKIKVSEWFAERGEFYQNEKEYESAFSNGSRSSAQVSCL